MIKYDGEIFEGSEEVQKDVIWWLTYLLGGKVVIPSDPNFWNENMPNDRSLVMYQEDGKMILAAERLDNV